MPQEKFINQISETSLKKRSRDKAVDLRGDYYRDQTAIIHSLPFRRMKRKTQVFFAPTNDHICTRIEHVLHVTSVATTICKGLDLDIELAQAIALGHDLGHPPFGHVGEQIINEIYFQYSGNRFIHEINSYRIVEYLANKGQGLNLCYSVKDGIISHCGEKYEQQLIPDFTVKNLDEANGHNLIPATYEGCVVRLADKISYLGRDIEDAMRLGVVNSRNISTEVLDLLGVTFDKLKDSVNSLIINYLINDAVAYSQVHKVIGISDEAHQIMQVIKDFNYQVIYLSKILKDYAQYVKKVIHIIYDELLELFKKNQYDYPKYKSQPGEPHSDFGRYLESYGDFYQKNSEPAIRIITDYIAGMTDNYALDFCKKTILPRKIF